MNKNIKIPAFTLPKNNAEFEWERVKLNVDGENIPVAVLDQLVKANCPYMKVREDSYFIRRIHDEFGDNVYLYYAIELSAVEKRVKNHLKKSRRKK